MIQTKKQLDDANKEIEKLNKEKNQVTKEIEKRKFEEQKDEINRQKTKIENYKKEINEFKDRVSKIEEENKNIKNDIGSRDLKIKELEDLIKEKEKEIIDNFSKTTDINNLITNKNLGTIVNPKKDIIFDILIRNNEKIKNIKDLLEIEIEIKNEADGIAKIKATKNNHLNLNGEVEIVFKAIDIDKITNIWNNKFKDKLKSSEKFSSILERFKKEIKESNNNEDYNHEHIQLISELNKNNRPKIKKLELKNPNDDSFQIKILNESLQLPFGMIEAASAPTKYRKSINGPEEEFNGMNNFDNTFQYNMRKKVGEVYEITQIGYYDDGNEIVAHIMPNIIDGGKITSTLPKEITSLQGMFYRNKGNNLDGISSWDTSNIVTMANMFRFSNNFNANIFNWDTSNVRSMSGMFYQALNFNQDISDWSTSNVTNMSWMFYKAKKFNQAIDTRNVFKQKKNYKSWDVSNVTDMNSMFRNAEMFNKDLNNWNTKNVRNMFQMFLHATSFNGNITNWNITNVENLRSIFYGATNFNQDISN
ncbi:BspA family leucine-rich repeat surface protein [Metamycoplasma alkalescens]|uniref:Surface protein n=3 Tax=Metamycoplasma alkalescens TaxID=45363 RepID=A0A318U8N1_9BACT|nr:BspA family leucine-rich repeat surface protein [Metamycoplasma alkalescens]PYF43611.1 surface protein [Metamycoplasma alkalescens]